jgi:hypothetical protein
MTFPQNPTDGQIFELENGIIFIYDMILQSWTQVSTGRVPLRLANDFQDGAMAAEDLVKINSLVIPPPISTLTTDNCNIVFNQGAIALEPSDNYVKIKPNLEATNIDEFGVTISKEYPFKIHDFTYGIDFNIDLQKFIDDMSARNKVKYKGPKGVQGIQGVQGEQGASFVYAGPQGNKGAPGIGIQLDYAVANEPFPVTTAVDLNKAITSAEIVTDTTDPTKRRIVLHRKTVGTDAAATSLTFNSGSSPWLLALDNNGGLPQAIHYLDVDPILDTIYSTFLAELNALKSSYEVVVQHYVGLMSAKFDQQKDALCCALEKCVSMTKNTDARQHMENVAAAALGKASIVIRGRKDTTASQISGTNTLQALGLEDDCWFTQTGVFPGSGPLNPIIEPSSSPIGSPTSPFLPSFSSYDGGGGGGGSSSDNGGGGCNCASFTISWDNSQITSKLLELGNNFVREKGLQGEFTIGDRDAQLDGQPKSDFESFTFPGCPPEGYVPQWGGYGSSFRRKFINPEGLDSGIWVLGGNVDTPSTILPDPNYNYLLRAGISVSGGVGSIWGTSESVDPPAVSYEPCNPIQSSVGGGDGFSSSSSSNNGFSPVQYDFKDCVQKLIDQVNNNLKQAGYPEFGADAVYIAYPPDFTNGVYFYTGYGTVGPNGKFESPPLFKMDFLSEYIRGFPFTNAGGVIVNTPTFSVEIQLSNSNDTYNPSSNDFSGRAVLKAIFNAPGIISRQPITDASISCTASVIATVQAASRIEPALQPTLSVPVHIDASVNNSILTSYKVELPAGEYNAKIIVGRAKANGMYRENVKFSYQTPNKKKLTEFQYRGEFTELDDAKDVYEGLTANFSHSGGMTEWWYPAEPGSQCQGTIDIEITQIQEDYRILQAGSCNMTLDKIKWYEKAWQKKECCGCVINYNSQDYIIIQKSLDDNLECGGGETKTEPCINVFARLGHPAFAFPTYDGQYFLVNDDIHFKYEALIDMEVKTLIQEGKSHKKLGNQTFDLILLPHL